MNYVKIKSIKKLNKKEQVYDIAVEDDHSFFGNGIGVHNSFDPNLQNFPKHGEEGFAFRKVFVAPEDYYFFEADYSGFQFRLMGIYSKDKILIDAFVKHGGDLHSLTGHDIFCRDKTISLDYFIQHKKESPFEEMRYKGKQTNLSFVFLKTAFSFQKDIADNWTEDQIDEYIKENNLEIILDNKTGNINKVLTVSTHIHTRFFKKYTGLQPYADSMQEFAKQNGYVDCPIFSGLRRHIPEMLQIGKNLSREKLSHYSTLHNISVNTGAQGGEGLIIDQALIKIQKEIENKNLNSILVGMVHDSIVGYVHKDEIKVMYKLLKNNMEIFDYDIPILCEIEMGKIWGFSPEIQDYMIEEWDTKKLIEYIEGKK